MDITRTSNYGEFSVEISDIKVIVLVVFCWQSLINVFGIGNLVDISTSTWFDGALLIFKFLLSLDILWVTFTHKGLCVYIFILCNICLLIY